MPKKSPHKVIYVRASEDIAEALERLAEKEQRSVSNMAEVLLRRQLEEEGELPKENRHVEVSPVAA